MILFSDENKIVLFFVAIMVLSPVFVFAQAQNAVCSPTGYTIETINGVFTNENGAIFNRDTLKRFLPPTYNNEPITVDYLMNPSHLAGLGDILKVTYQKVFDSETLQDYDLVEMLKSASEKVKTKKLLLVAHSQGNFYANSFYDSVTGPGGNLSPSMVGVYSVATPSGRVAGGGKWLTSDTDKIIAGVVASVPGRNIMKPNTHIALGSGDDSLGHNFSSVYLKYQSSRIVADIEESLGKLKYYNNVDQTKEPCITPPKLTLSHKIGGAVLAVADPVAETTVKGAGVVASGAYNSGLAVGGLVRQTAVGAAHAAGVVANAVYQTGVAMVVSTEKTILAISSATKQVGLALGASVFSSTSAEQTETNMALADNTPAQQKSPVTATVTQTEPADQTITESSPPYLEARLPSRVTEVVPQIPSEVLTLDSPPPSSGNVTTPQINFGMSLGLGGGGGGIPVRATDDLQLTTNDNTDTTTNVDTTTADSTTATSTTPTICEDSSATNFGDALPCVYPPEIPAKPTIVSPADFSTSFSTTTLTFVGTSSPSFVISNSLTGATTTVGGLGDWALTLDALSEGMTTVAFVATNLSGATSTPREISFSIGLPPPSPTIISPSDFSQTFETTSLTFTGTSSLGFTISNDFSSTTAITDGSGNWSIQLNNLPQATTVIGFYATNSTGLISPANSVSVIISVPVTPHCTDVFQSRGNYFANFENTEYLGGFLTVHFKLKTPDNISRTWTSNVSVLTDECTNGTTSSFLKDVSLPAGTQAWSIRFTSLTHFDIWNDETNTMATCPNCSQDITLFPSYYEVILSGNTALYESTLRSSAHRIMENAPNPPVKTFSLPTPAGCQPIHIGGYLFDIYEHARYVNGLLNYHFRFKPPQNNGRPFWSKFRLRDSECNAIAETNAYTTADVSLPAYVRYWSVRFSSPTHYDVWNDESETIAVCPACSVDIPATLSNGSPYSYVSFAGMFDPSSMNNTLESTSYRVTGD